MKDLRLGFWKKITHRGLGVVDLARGEGLHGGAEGRHRRRAPARRGDQGSFQRKRGEASGPGTEGRKEKGIRKDCWVYMNNGMTANRVGSRITENQQQGKVWTGLFLFDSTGMGKYRWK